MKIRSATFFMSRGAEKKVAKNRFFLICDACRITKDSPNQKDCPLFINRFFCSLGDSPIWRLTLLLTNAAGCRPMDSVAS